MAYDLSVSEEERWAELQKREARDYERALAQLDASWMSNTKWRKVLTAMAERPCGVTHLQYKFISSDHIGDGAIPPVGTLEECWIWDGNWVGGRLEYKWIEWVRVPRFVRSYDEKMVSGYTRVSQDVEGLRDVILGATGSAMLVLDEEYLWILGYSRRKT